MKGLALSLVMLLAVAPAWGAPDDADSETKSKTEKGQKAPTAKQKEQAKQAYLRAIEAYKAGNYEKAAVELKRVYTMVPIPAVLFNLGVTYAKLGKREAAKAAITEYLRAAPNAPNRGDAEKLLALLSGKGAASNAADAPAADKSSEAKSETSVAAAEETNGDESTEATATTNESPAANEPAVDQPEQKDAENPLVRAHERERDADERDRERDVDGRPAYGFWKWTTAGLAVAAVGAGIFFYHEANQQEATLRRIRGGPEELPAYAYDQSVRAVEDGYNSNRTWGTVAIVGGSIMAATSITLFVLDLFQSRKNSRAEVTPVAGSNFAGIAARGAF